LLLFFLSTDGLAQDPVREDGVANALRSLQARTQEGKLSPRTLERLRARLSTQPSARVIVELAAPDEPFAGLTGFQARSPATRVARSRAIARLRGRVLSRTGVRSSEVLRRFVHLPYVALELTATQLARLSDQPEVASVQVDERWRPLLADTAPQLGADLAWLAGHDGTGQSIAVLDSGVDTAHPAFAGRIVSEACYSTTSALDNAVSLCPNGQQSQTGDGAGVNCEGLLGCDHGTHVAGIALGEDGTFRGMAPGADLVAIQVFSQLNGLLDCGLAPPCLSAFTSDLIAGLERVYELRDSLPIAAVNLSLGGEAYDNPADCDAAYPSIKAAIDNLKAEGIATIAASGNAYELGAIATPACISSAVSVGAVGVLDGVGEFSNSASYLDVLAPGIEIVAAVPGGGYQPKTGTSMAAPHMSGAVAVLASAAPEATPDELMDAVKLTGVPVTDWRNGIVTPRVQIDAAAELLTAGDLDRLAVGAVPFLGGFDRPVAVTHAGDGTDRLFIAEAGGRVHIHDGAELLAAPLLDLATEICCPDRLIGIAFHPAHASNRQVFVSYLDTLGDVVVTRFTAIVDANGVDPGSAQEVIRIASSVDGHHGGWIAFGPDGYLYIATGDAATDGNVATTAQDVSVLLGKVLRLDVDGASPYQLPPDNPLLDVPGARGEIWSLGLRDPRRFAFDPLSGELFIADVGESQAHEINIQPAGSPGGEDYGWSQVEGSGCRPGATCVPEDFVSPVAEYGFADGCAVSGGVVYQGADYPDLYGTYLFGDLCSGRLWGLRDDDTQWQYEQLTDTPLRIVGFGSDENGNAYLIEVDEQGNGTLHRVLLSDLGIDTVRLPDAYTETPYDGALAASGGVAPFTWTVVSGGLPDGLSLDAASGTITGIPTATGPSVFDVQLQDATHASVTRTLRMTVTPPPLVINTATLTDATEGQGYADALVASGGSAPYVWSLTNGTLPVGITFGADGTLQGTPGEQGRFTFTATVTDATGDFLRRTFRLSVYGSTLALTLGQLETGQFGHQYGSNSHYIGLKASFTGAAEDLTLRVFGHDVDFVDELEVFLNDVSLGHLSVGPNNALNGGDYVAIPASAQLEGENVIRFEVKTVGWIWGVTDLYLSSEPAPLTVLTGSLPQASTTASYSQVLTATGGVGAYTWSVSAGALPAGLALQPDGTLAGTPIEQGAFSFTARVEDSRPVAAEQALSLTVVGASGTVELTLVPNTLEDGEYGNKYGSDIHPTSLIANFTGTSQDLTLRVTGYDIDYVDELEVFLNGQSLGHLSVGPNDGFNAGDSFPIPASAQLAGANQIEFRVKTAGWKWGVTDLLLTDQPEPLVIATGSLPDATYAVSYDQALTATGGTGPYTWSVSGGALPGGLALQPDGTLTGIPTEQGVFAFTAEVRDANDTLASQSLGLNVFGASGTLEVVLEIGVMDTGQYGNGYGSDVHPTGLFATFTGAGQDLTLSVTGYDIDFTDELQVLVNGVSLGYLSTGANNALNGGDSFVIPAASQLAGENQLEFRLKTAGWIWGVTGLLLSDALLPLQILSTSLPEGNLDEAYAETLTASGGTGGYDWSVTAGSLPAGLTLSPDGTLAGTPVDAGEFGFTVQVSDDAGTTAQQALSLVVIGPGVSGDVVLTPGVPDLGAYGNGYGSDANPMELSASFTGTTQDLTLFVTGYDIDFVDELEVLLNGVSLGYLSKGPNNGLNGGDSFVIPAASQLVGDNLLLFRVSTAGFKWGVTDLLLSDAPVPLAIATTSLPDASYATAYGPSLSAAGGSGGYTWSLSAGSLPSGLMLESDGTFSGAPLEQGIFDFTVEVTDGTGSSVQQALQLIVLGASGTVEAVLTIGQTDGNQYGYKYGSGTHKDALYAVFSGTTQDLTLDVTGYDIDYVDEIQVFLNGVAQGYLSKGPNNAYNAGDSFAIPAAAQLPGPNEIRFVQRSPGWKWGVTDLLLRP
jgi:subtilisin family serine protease